MRKRVKHYYDGGILTPELEAAGWRSGQNENIREEDRQAALAQFRAQMNAANSPDVYAAPQRQPDILTDQQAARLMGRPVNIQPTPQQRVAQSPEVYNPPRLPANFESGYPVPSRVSQEPFEANYPGPRDIRLSRPEFVNQQMPPQKPDTYLNTRVNPYVQSAVSDFLSRQDFANQNVPRSPEMASNPSRERLMHAIGEGSAEAYRRQAVNQSQMPNIMAKQGRDELSEYRLGRRSESELRRLAREREKWHREHNVPMEYDYRAYEPDVASERMAAVRESIANRSKDYKKGGVVKKKKIVKSKASSRGDGIAQRGKTKGRFV